MGVIVLMVVGGGGPDKRRKKKPTKIEILVHLRFTVNSFSLLVNSKLEQLGQTCCLMLFNAVL